ncbi:influenza virus NS1A-binding protein homolog [Antedon mediterranea]|uniref:influenza virus NS1A-binding protein homolog n=1 Tax=Antedon mediterranea TaxID=105859 RepID=UPI003AF54B4B
MAENYEDDDQYPREEQVADIMLVYSDDQGPMSTLKCMNELRKHRQNIDLILSVGNQEILAHRAVLSCTSPYIADLCRRQHSEGLLMHSLEGVDANAVEMIVNYSYVSQLEVPHNQVKEIYKAARHLEVSRVRSACKDHIVSYLSAKNSLGMRLFAEAQKDKDLIATIDSFILENIEDITLSNEFHQLPRLQIEVIAMKELACVSDRVIFEMALDWTRRTVRHGSDITTLMQSVQTLLLTEGNLLKDVNEMENLDPELILDYGLCEQANVELTPDKNICNNNSTNKLSPCNSIASRKLILTPQDLKSEKKFKNKWKVIASADMEGERYVAVALLNGILSSITLYEKPTTPRSSPSPRMHRILSIDSECSHPLLAQMKNAKSAIGTAEIDGKLIALGGYDRGECRNTVEMYDPVSNQWASLAPMTLPRGRFEVGVIHGKVYAVGGSNGHAELKQCEVFDMDTNKWKRITNIQSERHSSGATVLNDKLFVVGGTSGGKGLRTCEVYDPSTNAWSFIAPLVQGRSQVAVISLQGRMYAVGGSDSWLCLNSVEMYNPENDEWQIITHMKSNRRGAGLCQYDGKLYVFGGSDGSNVLNTVECYDPENDEWTAITSMETPRVNVGVVAIDGKIYAVGGFDGKNFLNTMECYDPEINQWTMHATHIFRNRARCSTPSPPGSPMSELNLSI